jgi:hypothetical protein
MDETRAVAKLPHLDIEVTHRRLSEEEAEEVTIRLRAAPSFDALARWLEMHPAWPWLAMSPFAAWQRAMLGLWAAPRARWPCIAPVLEPQSGERSGPGSGSLTADPKVHRFPGPGEREG